MWNIIRKGNEGMKTIVSLLVLGFALSAFAGSEITTSTTLAVEKGYVVVNKTVQNWKTDMAGTAFEQKSATFTNSAALSTGIASPGMAFFRNLSTNESATVTTTFKLAPGQFLQGPLGTNVVTIAPVSSNSVTLESIIISQ